MKLSPKQIKLILILLGLSLAATIAATIQPQLSMDEQSVIVDAVIQTINPAQMAYDIAATVEANVLAQIQNGAAANARIDAAPIEVAADPVQASAPVPEQATVGGQFQGLHAKFVNSYAYTTGETDENGGRVYSSEYTPNVLFNFDVVFENDGTVPWPAQIEMRNTGSVSTYTGHRESAVVDTSNDPVMPGERQGFTIAAHGSEELGWHTFYFQLYDAISGSMIAGGNGSFSYLAK